MDSATPWRNAQDVRAVDADLLQSLLHLFMLNRGVVLTPFHCMMLVSPATSAQQIDQLLNVFEQFLATLARQLKPPPPHPAKNAAGLV
jgi:glutamate-1-semialdehyde 2,1-aminomutase